MNQVNLVGIAMGIPMKTEVDVNQEIASLPLKTETTWYDETTGRMLKQPDVHILVFRGSLADQVMNNIAIGDNVAITGSLHNREWTNIATGMNERTAEINVSSWQVIEHVGVRGATLNFNNPVTAEGLEPSQDQAQDNVANNQTNTP